MELQKIKYKDKFLEEARVGVRGILPMREKGKELHWTSGKKKKKKKPCKHKENGTKYLKCWLKKKKNPTNLELCIQWNYLSKVEEK